MNAEHKQDIGTKRFGHQKANPRQVVVEKDSLGKNERAFPRISSR